MKRKHTPQFLSQAWVPNYLKTMVKEFMTWFVGKIGAAKPFMPVIEEALTHTENRTILNIGHESGAGIETVKPYLDDDIHIIAAKLSLYEEKQKGLYLSVNGFHQLRQEEASSLLEQIVARGNPVAVVEGNNDSLWQVVGMTIFVPLTVLLTAPLVKPFRFGRLIFTYLIPVLPLITMIDGCMALFRLYAPSDLDELTHSIDAPSYQWRSGKMDNGRGGKIIYLLGYPL
ncbi:MAG: hypothetical protein AAF824_24730 [Bacteroidota bacterium]